MRQLDAELRRFFARRIVRGTFLVAALIIAIAVGVGTANGHKGTSLEYDPSTGTIIPSGESVSDPGRPFVESGNGSGTFVLSQSDTRTNIGKDLRKVLEGTGIALLFAGFALGASFVGAEFNVGSLTTQLLFEPRRWRVHGAKAAAVAIGAATLALAVMLLVALAMYIGSLLGGVVDGITATWVFHRVAEAIRIAAAVGAGAVLAYAITLVAKRSSAGMIAMFLQYPLLFLLDPAKKPFGVLSHYMPLRGLLAIAADPAGATGVNERTIHTMAGGAVLVVVWLAVIVSSSGFAFSRAEVR
ncbi:MAG: hypothetical protein QOF59_985 [Actinomycetota bacterium]|nr:hypothetical protein [Actinomycetota bacterium]